MGVQTSPPPVESHHRTPEQQLAFHEHSEHVAPFLGLIVFAQALAFLWLVLVLWPVASGTETTTVVLVWGVHWTVTVDVALVSLVLATGALGSVVHEVQSLTYHRGNDDFSADWALWYFLRPLLGAGVAGFIFFIVRGGLLQIDAAPSESINMFGMAGLAALAGLFATPAMTKLSNVFDTMLGPAKMTTNGTPADAAGTHEGAETDASPTTSPTTSPIGADAADSELTERAAGTIWITRG